METFILIGNLDSSLFFIHEKSQDNDLQASYHLFYPLEHMGFIPSKDVIVNIFELGTDGNLEMISLQHVDRGSLAEFEIENINEVFKSLCEDNINCIFLEYERTNKTYRPGMDNINLRLLETKTVKTIDYIMIKNQQLS